MQPPLVVRQPPEEQPPLEAQLVLEARRRPAEERQRLRVATRELAMKSFGHRDRNSNVPPPWQRLGEAANRLPPPLFANPAEA